MASEPAKGFKPDTACMEVPRCDICRWWEREDVGVEMERLVDDFDASRKHTSRGLCKVLSRTGDPSVKLHLSGRSRAVLTDADFGCVQFDANPLATKGLED